MHWYTEFCQGRLCCRQRHVHFPAHVCVSTKRPGSSSVLQHKSTALFQLTDSIDLMFGWQVIYAPYSESTDCCQGRLCCRQSTSSAGHMCATFKLPGPCTVCYSTSQLTALQLTALRCNSIISAVVWRVSVAKTACRSCAHNKSHLCDCNCSAHVQATLPQQRKAAQCATFTYQGCA